MDLQKRQGQGMQGGDAGMKSKKRFIREIRIQMAVGRFRFWGPGSAQEMANPEGGRAAQEERIQAAGAGIQGQGPWMNGIATTVSLPPTLAPGRPAPEPFGG